MISDRYLAELASRDPGQGTFSEAEQAAWVMAAPVIAAELLRHRGQPRPVDLAERANVIDLHLWVAEQVLCRDNATPAETEQACRIILTHNRNPYWIDAAKDVLLGMGVAV